MSERRVTVAEDSLLSVADLRPPRSAFVHASARYMP